VIPRDPQPAHQSERFSSPVWHLTSIPVPLCAATVSGSAQLPVATATAEPPLSAQQAAGGTYAEWNSGLPPRWVKSSSPTVVGDDARNHRHLQQQLAFHPASASAALRLMYLPRSVRLSGEYCTFCCTRGGIGLVSRCGCSLAPGRGGSRFSPFGEAAGPTVFLSIGLYPLPLPLASTPTPDYHQRRPAPAPRI